MFDTPPEGEWQGLADALAKADRWVDYILADAHEDFPRYPLDVGVPGNLPLLNFPEISMWGNWPWGGSGANPLPARFQRLWDQVKHVVQGGFPYSEGIYEDMNKAVVAQFYWDRDRSARETLEEYIAYEFGPGVDAGRAGAHRAARGRGGVLLPEAARGHGRRSSAPTSWRKPWTPACPTGPDRTGAGKSCTCARCSTANVSPAAAWRRPRPKPPCSA